MEKEDDPCSSSSAAPCSTQGLKEELLCPICYEPFREAVTLPCGHNFCRSCISRSWENQRHACPLCKERSSLEDLRVNHTLKNLVELVMKEEGQRQSRGVALCPLHQEEPKFFCLEDKELACFACQSSEQHEGHKMRPVQEAAADFRAKLANMESSLRDKAKDFGAVRRSYESISRHNEGWIHGWMDGWRDECMGGSTEGSKEGSLPSCELPIKHSPSRPVPFSLDPNSAAGWLSVSEDLSSVSSCGYKGSVENPERFTSAPCILGSRGFSEGFHTWEVDLGGLTNWRVGVSRPHKGSHWSFHHDSRSGFWYIYHLHGKDECRASNAVRSQTALGNIRRVRVELDCTEGELSFYDAELQSHIYTFHEKFGGVVFPYFYVGSSQGDANTNTLRICPLRVRVLEDVPT
ncbi:E3 ubiquitin-protein ligase TRIM35-like [Pyrgilauda ruficollis]|uniref:E3 ubiquitin-protein ligase TRIM35-like n=1 Tax=Pyrgilauda ruficollis TaxID=221976 RepID=UPI001B87A991|nr:E3 ubiquitin-protein ligase TRIM35-like [Pyrgilauda ruficollis]